MKDNYVNNKEFVEMILRYKKDHNKKDWEDIGRIFLAISERVLYKPCFVNYSTDIKDNAVSDACYYMSKYVENFDPTKSDNAFAFFTQFVYNAMKKNINSFKQYSEQNLRIESNDMVYDNDDSSQSEDEFVLLNEESLDAPEVIDVSTSNIEMSRLAKYFE